MKDQVCFGSSDPSPAGWSRLNAGAVQVSGAAAGRRPMRRCVTSDCAEKARIFDELAAVTDPLPQTVLHPVCCLRIAPVDPITQRLTVDPGPTRDLLAMRHALQTCAMPVGMTLLRDVTSANRGKPASRVHHVRIAPWFVKQKTPGSGWHRSALPFRLPAVWFRWQRPGAARSRQAKRSGPHCVPALLPASGRATDCTRARVVRGYGNKG